MNKNKLITSKKNSVYSVLCGNKERLIDKKIDLYKRDVKSGVWMVKKIPEMSDKV